MFICVSEDWYGGGAKVVRAFSTRVQAEKYVEKYFEQYAESDMIIIEQSDETTIRLSWECPTNSHVNHAEMEFEINADIDDTIESFCSDPEMANEHPCQECGEIGFNEIDWNYVDLLSLDSNTSTASNNAE